MEIDTGATPAAALREPDDFSSFKRLAGARANDPAWLESFGAMLDYAAGKGWLSADGSAIQAHVEASA